VGIGLSAGVLLSAWGLIELSPDQDDRKIELSSLHHGQPDGCDFVVTSGWFGAESSAISDALTNATDGSRLCVGSGRYEDAIRVEAAVEIIGFGDTPPVIVSPTAADVVQWHAKGGLLENLILIQAGGVPSGSLVTGQNGSQVFRIGQPSYFDDEAHSGVTLVNSHATMNNVAIENDIFSGVFANGPDAILDMSNSVISNSAEAGVLAINGAKVTLNQTEISNSDKEGIRLDTGAQLQADEVDIIGSGQSAVFSQNRAGFEIANSSIKTRGAPGIVQGNRSGAGAVFDTEIAGLVERSSWGIAMRGGTDLHLERVTVSGGREGVLCLPVIGGPESETLRLSIYDSRIINNHRWGVSTSGDCDVTIQGSTISRNRDGGIENGGMLTVSGSRLIENGSANSGAYRGAGLSSRPASALTIYDTEITGNRPNGLVLSAGAQVEIEATTISGNQETGVLIPVLPKSDAQGYARDMERLKTRHDLGPAAATMNFQDVTLEAHSDGAWRFDTGYLDEGDYIAPVINGLDP